MMRHLVVGFVAAALLTTACGHEAHHASPPAQLLEADGVVMARPAADIDYRSLQVGSRDLGYDLGRALIGNAADGNLVYSPTSLAIAFAMLREGADPAAGAAIDRALHLPADRQVAYNALVTALAEPGAGNELSLGNGIFLQSGYAVKHPFLAALMRWYGAGVLLTDFPSGDGVDDINGYVSDKTRGRIPHLLDELPVDEVMVLVNTLYLNAKWQVPFDLIYTVRAPFTTGAGATVSVKTMSRTGQVDFAQGDGWQAVRLPYRGDRLSMWILLPKTADLPIDLLSPEVLAAAGSRFSGSNVYVSLPRWDVDNKIDLKPALTSLGLQGVFDTDGLFTRITSDPTFKVTQVLQQADISVGEKGTVAAAASVNGAVGGSDGSVQPIQFTADHPFAFAIMDTTTGTPLFEGTVADPSRTP